MADSSAHLQHKHVESASSTTDDTHKDIRLTVQPKVKSQTLSTTTTTVKIIRGLLVALVVAVVVVLAVAMTQQPVKLATELKEKIPSLQKKTPKHQNMLDKLTETAASYSVQTMTQELQTMMTKVTETELPQTPQATIATTTPAIATTYSVTCQYVVDFYNMSSCAVIHTRLPACASGVYTIYLEGRAPGRSVWCDMDTDGGGWTLFQRRYDGTVSFNEAWEVYQKGFGSPSGEFWLGNDDLYRLTTAQPSELRVDILDWNGTYGYAKYDSFSVGSSSTNYKLHIAGYTGNLGDSLVHHHSWQFSTKDRDNDGYDYNCAIAFGGSGGWWYHRGCHHVNLNGRYFTGGVTNHMGVLWYYWENHHPYYSYKAAAMLTRPASSDTQYHQVSQP